MTTANPSAQAVTATLKAAGLHPVTPSAPGYWAKWYRSSREGHVCVRYHQAGSGHGYWLGDVPEFTTPAIEALTAKGWHVHVAGCALEVRLTAPVALEER